MADFSQYGGASDEWRATEKTITFSSASAGISPVDLQKKMNETREQAAAKAMESMKGLVQTQDYSIPTRDGSAIEARLYRPSSASQDDRLPVFLFFHGGGFLMGTLGTEDATCSWICTSAQVAVLHVNYRHTPKFPYPTAWDDAEDGFIWLHKNIDLVRGDPDQVIVGGISAGAQLTASLVLRKNMGEPSTKDYPEIAGQVLMIPCLVGFEAYEPQLKKLRDPSVSSYKENENSALLPMRTVRMFTELLQVGTPDPADLRLCPGNASVADVRGLPPTTFGVAGLDPLRDEGLLYSQLLAEAGVPTDTYVFEGVPHGFRRFGDLSQSKRWDSVLAHSVGWSLSQPKANEFLVKTEGP
ncbi:AB hydrolase superfamily protein B1A11.02 like [Verticillium longisporum]|nr:AB hydrolase superfamily protein B1A11.02 like [Verticillium longisporum]